MKKSILCATVMLAAAAFVTTIGPAQIALAQQGKGGGKQNLVAPSVAAGPRSDDGQIHVLKVQGNIYMLVGAPAGNIALQVGDSGVLLVDTMTAAVSDKVVAAIRTISDKPIRYIINTTFDPDHTGGNANVAKLGAPVVGGNLGNANRGAAIIASENLANRMSSQTLPAGSLPTVTYFEGQKELFFNNEGIQVMLAPKAHTDGDSIVYFRRSDVVVAGDIFLTTTFPVINIEAGGNVNGVIAGLNHVLDLAIPEHEQEGGTYIIPGHGRLCDEHDVLEYRDMVTIVRDRVQSMIKKGLTLAQVKAARPTLDYDGRYGTMPGPGSTDAFVEAVYKSLEKK